jgi:nitrogenase molybdenum-iron protein NifN
MISHFKEPVDIASSNFSEESTVFGGAKNFCDGISNIIKQYNPEVIGIASTCLSETIGEDIPRLINEFKNLHKNEKLPEFIHVSTPSYQGSHMEGFHETVYVTISSLAEKTKTNKTINIFPGFISPADIRHLKDILTAFGLPNIMFPDYSETLDNPNWAEYQLIPEGGTTIDELKSSGSSRATIEFGTVLNNTILNGTKSNRGKLLTAGNWLEQKHKIPLHRLPLPIGITATDSFYYVLEKLSGKPTPKHLSLERGRLIDSYVDGHKYVFGKRAIVYGEEDFVISMVSFLEEIGIETVLAGSGGESGILKSEIERITEGKRPEMIVLNNLDFEAINEMAYYLKPDLFIGNSKGYYIARRLGKPLIRTGFPIHDRFGAQRLQHLCYKGTQELFDRIVNALIEYKQEHSPVGYKYI